jgi:HK97 family phage major capsid protein
VDPRLYGAAASGASTNVGPDAGFLVQKEYAVELISKGEKAGELSSRCSTTEIGPNADSLEVVVLDDYSRATGSRWGGVRVYRKGEADTVTNTQPKLGRWEARLEDMMGLAYITERAMQDASSMGQVFSDAFTEEFAFKLDDEIMRGTGAGQCHGLIGHPATIAVAKETGQAAKTIVFENVSNMWARVPYKHRARGAWFYNVEAEPQLQQLQIGTGTSATLVYLPPGGIRGNADFGTIYGRPAIPIEHADALGTVGDLSFFDLTEYKLITKGGIASDESIHVRFIYNERALRWVLRVNGAPKWKTVLTPYKGANTLSPFVQIATRA